MRVVLPKPYIFFQMFFSKKSLSRLQQEKTQDFSNSYSLTIGESFHFQVIIKMICLDFPVFPALN